MTESQRIAKAIRSLSLKLMRDRGHDEVTDQDFLDATRQIEQTIVDRPNVLGIRKIQPTTPEGWHAH